MQNGTVAAQQTLRSGISPDWRVVGTAEDGFTGPTLNDDLLWRNSVTGALEEWQFHA